MKLKIVATGFLIAAIFATAGGTALAQRGAAPKVRGDVYFVYIAEMYRDQAGAHNFFLDAYANGGPADKSIVAEHAAGIRAAVTAGQKAYGKLSAAAKKDPAAVARLQAVDKDQAAMLELCGKLDAEAAKAQPDSAKVHATCLQIMDRIDAADASHARLMEQLGIKPVESLEPPGK